MRWALSTEEAVVCAASLDAWPGRADGGNTPYGTGTAPQYDTTV